jgi:hypothetical protein
VEEEAKEGYLKGGELCLFTNNATAKGCFFCGGSSSKLLHKLVLRLRKTELEYDFALHVVHVAGTRMIMQGTDGLSWGIFLKGVVRGKDMLSFMDLSQTAIERHPGVLEFVSHGYCLSWERARYSNLKNGFGRVMGSSAARKTRAGYGFRNMQGMERSTFGPRLLSLQMLPWKSVPRLSTSGLMLTKFF